MEERRRHWEKVYHDKAPNEVSWFQAHPVLSLALIERADPDRTANLIDVGGGDSRLVDELLQAGGRRLTVLDISEAALARARARLGGSAAEVRWIATDVTEWEPDDSYDIWHDRAAFHFLVEPADRAAYADRLRRALKPGGTAILAAFAPDGPEQCSGLPVQRYDGRTALRELGDAFELVEETRHTHITPWESEQHFVFCLFHRR